MLTDFIIHFNQKFEDRSNFYFAFNFGQHQSSCIFFYVYSYKHFQVQF